MPLANGYGVVAGTVASFSREERDAHGHVHRGLLRIKTPDDEWEAVLDVAAQSGVGVSFRVVRDISASWMPKMSTFPDGLHRLGRTFESGAVDYLRSPMLRPGWAITWPGRMLLRGLGRIARGLGLPVTVRRPGPWVASDGENALDALESLLNRAARVLVYGEPGYDGLGLHNVHMNQGDPPGEHQGQNGGWQDGAVVCEDADGRFHAWQVRFNSQSLRTGPAGRPA
jgi:Uncharacterized conserved protein (DUF2278)